ncbi:hypothetical protein ACOMHN_027483 [Nucella lapillus]
MSDGHKAAQEDGRAGHGEEGGVGQCSDQTKVWTLSDPEDGDFVKGFYPSLTQQRYGLLRDTLQERGIKSVVDFGSSTCSLFRYLKSEGTGLIRVALVDLDKRVLEENTRAVRPLIAEHIMLRRIPLTVSMYHGNAGELDSRLAGFQAASLVEVIEHLEPEVLEEVRHNVFGRLRPSLVIVTTPNAEYNILFRNFSGFRHYDHKFEWTQKQFQTWCGDVCQHYGYSVKYTGVGQPPPAKSHLGFCSQAAVFTECLGKEGEKTEDTPYQLIEEVTFPHDSRTSAERLADAARCGVQTLSQRQDCRGEGEGEGRASVPVLRLWDLVCRSQDTCTLGQLLDCLHSSEFKLTEDETCVEVQLEEEEEEEEEEENSYSAEEEAYREMPESSCVVQSAPSEPEEMWV